MDILRHQEQRRKGSVVARPGLGIFLTVLIGLSFCTIRALGAPESDAERLKSFVHDPPIIKSIHFKVRGPGMSPIVLKRNSETGVYEADPTASRALDPRDYGFDKDGFKFFLGRWQPNAFLLYQLAPGDGATSKGEINRFYSCGHYESNYWVLQGQKLETAVWPTPGSSGSNETSRVYSSCQFHSKLLAKVLNMGVIDVGIGSINWEGNKFAIPSSGVSGVVINGAAISNEGRLKRIDLLYNQYSYQVVYHYDHPLNLAFLPDRFETWCPPSIGKEIKYEFRIISVESSTDSLPASFFDPVTK